ncbi:hypothetical protein, partial [Klebsiella pneumoniae]|uniref:hypothetical protein n=1 Tax=Klebsiella pneumoniae TaxID=573 RepID=UPI001954AA0A
FPLSSIALAMGSGMSTIRYLFNEAGTWNKITNFISSNHRSVNSQSTLRNFVKNLGAAISLE